MEVETVRSRQRRLVADHGAWTAHNIHLGGGHYTIAPQIVGDEVKLRRITQVVQDAAGGGCQHLRVLDLGCLEGLFGIELARRGARVVGIEGRTPNIEKARFAQGVLGLENLVLHQDDVRNLSRERYGEFDVVLCLGLLYHLDAPEVFQFLEQMAAVCTGFAVVDTHVSLTPETRREYAGTAYWGRDYREHEDGTSPDQRLASLWASLDNERSFWPTRASLLNALARAGFTSVSECHNPSEIEKPEDRITLLAFKGKPVSLQCAPLLDKVPTDNWPEHVLPAPERHPTAVAAKPAPAPWLRRLAWWAR